MCEMAGTVTYFRNWTIFYLYNMVTRLFSQPMCCITEYSIDGQAGRYVHAEEIPVGG